MKGGRSTCDQPDHIGLGVSAIRKLLLLPTDRLFWTTLVSATIVLVIGISLSAALNLTVDEAFALHTTSAGPVFAWQQAIVFEQQPPLYFVVESIWRMCDESSIVFARLPSALFAATAVAIIIVEARRIAPNVPSIVVAAITGLNPFVIWAAVEMRVYALVFLIGATLAWTFFEGFLVANPSHRARLLYFAFAIAGLYTQYYVGFLLAAHFISLLLLRRRGLGTFAGAMAIVAIAFAPFVGVAITHVEGSSDFVSRVSVARAAYEIAAAVFMFVLPHTLNSAGPMKVAFLALSLFLAMALLLIGRPAICRDTDRAFLVQWLISLTLFSLVFGYLSLPQDPLRHLAVIAPSSLLVALLITSSLTRMRVVVSSIALVAFIVLAPTQLWSRYRVPLAKPGDYQRVAAKLLSAAETDTPIAAFPAELVVPLRSYLRASVISIPRPLPFSVDYVRLTTITDDSQVSRVLDPVRARSRTLWLVTPDECGDTLYKDSCRFVEDYMKKRYRIQETAVFRGTLARLYTRLPMVSNEPRVTGKSS
jgi:uncharacterized membrane protein